MPKYIKIKSATGKGEMVVKRSLIERVEDRDDGGATIHCSDCVYQTASTAAEVLEAMEGKPSSCPTHFVLHRREGNAGTDWHNAILTIKRDEGPIQRTNSIGINQVSAPKRFAVHQHDSNDWRVYDTSPPKGDDGCNGIFVTRERAEEYAASRERKTAQHGTGFGGSEPVLDAENSCFCTNFAGQNSKCPQHGIGTAWRDLHGE